MILGTKRLRLIPGGNLQLVKGQEALIILAAERSRTKFEGLIKMVYTLLRGGNQGQNTFMSIPLRKGNFEQHLNVCNTFFNIGKLHVKSYDA